MFAKYKAFIEKYIDLGSAELNYLKSKLIVKTFKKGEVILYMGDVCNKLYFITTGLARGYLITNDGKDYTWSIFFNDKNSHMSNLFVVDYESFINGSESKLTIEALEDCQLLGLSKEAINELNSRFKSSERFSRLMSQEAYSYLHNRFIDMQLKSAKERFEDFMKKTPFLLEKVPQYHIASFLGITPQHLSRLKKEIG